MRSRCEIKQRGACALFLAQGLEGGSQPRDLGEVFAINDRYRFELRRLNPAARWAIHRLDLDPGDGAQAGFEDPIDAVARWCTCPVTLRLVPYFNGVEMSDPDFPLNRVTAVTRNGTQAVKVELDYHPPANRPRVPALKGWVLFDPKRSWVIREYNFRARLADVTSSIVTNYEYRDGDDGLPIPRRVTCRFTPVKGVDRESLYEFDLKEGDVPAGDFTLSAFGLPEPGGVRGWSPPWYLLAVILGVVCLGAAALLRWRARRGSGGLVKG